MGRREIIISGLLAALTVGGGAVVTAYTTATNDYTPYLRSVGWLAFFGGAIGLAYMFRTAPKGVLNAAQEVVAGPPPREFLGSELTPSALYEKVRGKTSLQIEGLTKTYAGKWMRVEGPVLDASKLMSGTYFLQIREVDGHYAAVSVSFSDKWADQLRSVNVGDWIVVVGKLDAIRNRPHLIDGEIEHLGPPPKKPDPRPKAPPRAKRPAKPAA